MPRPNRCISTLRYFRISGRIIFIRVRLNIRPNQIISLSCILPDLRITTKLYTCIQRLQSRQYRHLRCSQWPCWQEWPASPTCTRVWYPAGTQYYSLPSLYFRRFVCLDLYSPIDSWDFIHFGLSDFSLIRPIEPTKTSPIFFKNNKKTRGVVRANRVLNKQNTGLYPDILHALLNFWI